MSKRRALIVEDSHYHFIPYKCTLWPPGEKQRYINFGLFEKFTENDITPSFIGDGQTRSLTKKVEKIKVVGNHQRNNFYLVVVIVVLGLIPNIVANVGDDDDVGDGQTSGLTKKLKR